MRSMSTDNTATVRALSLAEVAAAEGRGGLTGWLGSKFEVFAVLCMLALAVPEWASLFAGNAPRPMIFWALVALAAATAAPRIHRAALAAKT